MCHILLFSFYFFFFPGEGRIRGYELWPEFRPVAFRTPQGSKDFFWKEIGRPVRNSGNNKKISKEESETYFHSRPIGSQLGAWSSPQSRIIPDRTFLEDLVAETTEKFKDGIIPLPPDWGGYIIHPTEIEFWQGRSSRLHDRLQYSLHDNGHWVKVRLAP